MVKELICLMIGNSRLHWAWFRDKTIIKIWHTEHFKNNLPPENLPAHIPLYVASVVPEQTELCKEYCQPTILNLSQIPINNLYPTMGIDRALALWGAGIKYGFPCLVIDAGTALTFSGVNDSNCFIGGAILPGLGLQLQSLSNKTAALPEVFLPQKLPELWAKNTEDAIINGVVYSLLAGIQLFITNWLAKYPDSNIIITGGDSDKLLSYFCIFNYQLNQLIIKNENIIFWGIKNLVELVTTKIL
jgi:type III pantothenate kinase